MHSWESSAFAVKHNIDRLVATFGFHRPWGVFNYWEPLRNAERITALTRTDAVFLATLVALALPFVWVGVVLTMKRLRDVQLPSYLVALFFVPFLNLLFFILLCLLPGRDVTHSPATHPSIVRFLPKSGLGAAALSVVITAPIGFGIAVLGSQLLVNYGWGLFIATPFVIGFAAAGIFGLREDRTLWGSVGVACLSIVVLGVALLGLAFEGVGCILMAVPLALPLAAMGGGCAHAMMRLRRFRGDAPVFMVVVLAVAPGVQWIEHVVSAPSPVFVVRSAIEIQAPPERVWKQVVAFSQIPPPSEWLFRSGIAYPIRAEMVGTGVGAERHCIFSTGAFVEPIQVWNEPRQLKFSVTSNPPPMEEWTPYRHIEPPHLHGFLVSEGGQFLLTPLPNGSTRLEGTTWYRHGLWPAAYWRLWSDAIIHRIHLRVLNHIRAEVEKRPS